MRENFCRGRENDTERLNLWETLLRSGAFSIQYCSNSVQSFLKIQSLCVIFVATEKVFVHFFVGSNRTGSASVC